MSIALLNRLIVVMLATLLASCGNLVRTYELDSARPNGDRLRSSGPEACATNLGTYALPNRHLVITLAADGTELSVNADEKSFPDADTLFCLDYLHSPFGRNDIAVTRTDDGLLTKVFTEFESQAVDVARETIDATVNLVSAGDAAQLARTTTGQNGGTTAPSGIVASETGLPLSFTFDPFDRAMARLVNEELERFGYCVYFDNRNDPRIPDWWPSLCQVPSASTTYSFPPEQFARERRVALELSQRAILHRPEISHRLVVLRKEDPEDPHEPWVMVGSERVLLPNRAPIMGIGLTRGLFADADTTIDFHAGVLTNVTIVKPSEVAQLVEIPIYAINAVLAIPARTLAILENDVQNREALIATNVELIDLLEETGRQVQADRAVASGTSGVNAVLLPASRSTDLGVARSGQNCLDDDELLLSEDGIELCRTILQQGD